MLVGEVSEFLRKAGGFKSSIFRIGKLLTRTPFNGTAIQFRVGESRFRGVVVRNHKTWEHASGRAIMDHIQGVSDDVGTEDADVDLLA